MKLADALWLMWGDRVDGAMAGRASSDRSQLSLDVDRTDGDETPRRRASMQMRGGFDLHLTCCGESIWADGRHSRRTF
ncbi:MAG TPA: hypothetical protein VFE05_09855, partial [Longimicrobiaceae bacterium]|nr:hypothetical protein [Longimicrobiaceae bacterium]